ncbi:hypothetical protein ACJIZ3_002817 [Penstemon smallii]|uniref:Cupredoxin n=1 Tax=Penstemon smallii TaxID=265156 RepID=A0ABD3U7G2_9LAMI
MGFSSMLFFIFSFITLLLFQLSQSATVVVDGVSKWKNPEVQIGASVIFQHKYNYSLYIFKNQNAYSSCNFTQATLLTKPNSISYTWHTSRPGFFYFSFNNGSNKACLDGQKFAVKVSHSTSPEVPPTMAVAPPPSTGGSIASSPAFPWPFQPRENVSPSPAPGLDATANSPMAVGIPLINSNPAVPLPTGEVDSATIRPFPTSGHHHFKQVVGFSAVARTLSSVIFLMILLI